MNLADRSFHYNPSIGYHFTDKCVPSCGETPVTTRISKTTGIKTEGTGLVVDPQKPIQITKSFCLLIAMPPQVPWHYRLWRVLCLPYDIIVFIKTGKLRFL